jgi:galactokinase
MISNLQALWLSTHNDFTQVHPYFSPGRVNLMGEHIDYNGGNVFPTALSIGTYGLFAKRADRKIRLTSGNFPALGWIEASLDDLSKQERREWANYALGVVAILAARGTLLETGFDLAVWGDLPHGAGLSSSASLEVLVATILNDQYGLKMTRLELALLAKEVENRYIGVQCGIMDQFVIALGEANKALLIDTAALTYEAVPLDLPDHAIVILNSNVRRGLVDSAYNQRRDECKNALAILQTRYPIQALCDLSEASWNEAKELLSGNVLKRARHAVTEQHRTLKAVQSLQDGDLNAFGSLMIQTHRSLRDDYEVSRPELDCLVEAAVAAGALGARMTGAGFGGCAVAIVPKNIVPSLASSIQKTYHDRFGLTCGVFVAQTADGTKELR